MEVAAQTGVHHVADLADNPLGFEGQAPAVGVTQDQDLGPGCSGRSDHVRAEAGVGPVAVEEMLGVEKHPPALPNQERN